MYCKDHLGNRFRTKAERADHYGLNCSTVNARLKASMTLESALTSDSHTVRRLAQQKNKETRGQKVTDADGNEYVSIAEMCNTYGISHVLFCHRLQRGWSLKEALGPKRR